MREDADDVIDELADDMLAQAKACVKEFGTFQLALSGGNSPMPLYRRLILDPAYRLFPWANTHLWIVDERIVPFDDDRSNWGHIKELIVEHSGIPHASAHPMQVDDPDGARLYSEALHRVLGNRPEGHRRLDMILLGMGPDGHTASLFPHSPAQSECALWCTTNAGPTVVPPDRMTMTYPLINAARMVAVLALGEGKRAMLHTITQPDVSWCDYPILGINPVAGSLRWYLDRAACPTNAIAQKSE